MSLTHILLEHIWEFKCTHTACFNHFNNSVVIRDLTLMLVMGYAVHVHINPVLTLAFACD